MHIPDQESRGHISPTKMYYGIGSVLLLLTVITVAAAQVDWGAMLGVGGMLINVLIALFIATVKAGLVLLYFMHMKHESKLIWGMGIVYPLVLFAIMIGFFSMDVFLRLNPVETKPPVKQATTVPVPR